jgi:hypothetical protein
LTGVKPGLFQVKETLSEEDHKPYSWLWSLGVSEEFFDKYAWIFF